jgi:hypothetical protein
MRVGYIGLGSMGNPSRRRSSMLFPTQLQLWLKRGHVQAAPPRKSRRPPMYSVSVFRQTSTYVPYY